MPKEALEHAADTIPAQAQEQEHHGEQEKVTATFNPVGGIVAVVQPFCSQTLIQCAIFSDDFVLRRQIQRWVLREVQVNMFLRYGI
jgi:hypothetical protein